MTAASIDHTDVTGHVRDLVKRAGTSFYWAMRFLPTDKQQAMFAVYAYCRAVDDVADQPAPAEQKRKELADWRAEIDAMFDNRPQTIIGAALRAPIAQFGLEKDQFVEILNGMKMDADGPIRAPSLAELECYCGRVAGAVGQLSVRIFGCDDPRAGDFAMATGMALQLTNILRDLDEDADDGRLYLPRELLDAAGIDSDDPRVVLDHPALTQVCAALADRALDAYAESARLRAAMPAAAQASLKPALIMAAIYRRILDRLIARGWTTVDQPVKVGKLEKLWIALTVGRGRR